MSIHQVRKPLQLIGMLLLVVFLSHCAQRKKVDVEGDVRDPANENDSLIQVTPMLSEAVKTLLQEADQQVSQDQIPAALLTLKRALSISPASALVKQHLAEVYLSDADYQQAMYWSTLVVNQGPDQGRLCERSRRTQALAAEMLGNTEVQAQALNSINSCSTDQPARY